jgi:phospholipase/carboxylesterase
MIVLCHGVASDGSQMEPLAKHWSRGLPDAAFLAPHAPFPFRRRGFPSWPLRSRAREWYSLKDASRPAQEPGVRFAADVLNPYVDEQATRLGVPLGAVALAGFSQGAMVALFAGLRRPVPPAGVVVFAGALLAPTSLPGELRSRPPVLLLPGEKDEIVTLSESLAAMQALSACDVPVRMEPLADAGHSLHPAGMAISAGFLQEAFS